MTAAEQARPAPDGERLVRRIAELMDDKKGVDIVALDVRGLANFTDFFIVCSGRTDRQVKAIHDAIREGVKAEFGIIPERTEGEGERTWILLDYADCVAHVMQPDTREFYRLEQLWGDAPRVDLQLPEAPGDAVAGSSG